MSEFADRAAAAWARVRERQHRRAWLLEVGAVAVAAFVGALGAYGALAVITWWVTR